MLETHCPVRLGFHRSGNTPTWSTVEAFIRPHYSGLYSAKTKLFVSINNFRILHQFHTRPYLHFLRPESTIFVRPPWNLKFIIHKSKILEVLWLADEAGLLDEPSERKYWVHPLIENHENSKKKLVFYNDMRKYPEKFFNYYQMFIN